MLVLTRKSGESIVIDGNIKITVKIKGNRVQLLIDAPKDIPVRRGELVPRSPDGTAEAA